MQAIAAEETARPGQYTRPRVRPEFAQWLDRETPVLAGLRHRYGIDLVKDHDVPEGRMRDPSEVRDVAELVAFDPAALARLRSAVGF